MVKKCKYYDEPRMVEIQKNFKSNEVSGQLNICIIDKRNIDTREVNIIDYY